MILNTISLSWTQIEVLSLNNQHNQRINPLGVEVFLDKDPSGEAVPNYQLNESIQIGVRPSSSGYLYLFHLNSQGKAAQIFPNRYNSNNFLREGKAIHIPNGPHYSLSVSGPEGLGHIVAIVSKRRLEGHKVTFADYFEGYFDNYKPKYSPASFWTIDAARFWLGNHNIATITSPNTPVVSSAREEPSSPPDGIIPNPSALHIGIHDAVTSTNTTSTNTTDQAITAEPNRVTIGPDITDQATTPSQATMGNTSQAATANQADQDSYSKWRAANVQNYSFIFKQECYCTEEYLKAMYVVVREGKVSSVVYTGDNQSVPDSVFASVLTLEELLEGTSKVEKNSASKVEGEYDRDFGFPKKLFIDNNINSVNDEISYEVSFFRVE